jgi:hypothetical protein
LRLRLFWRVTEPDMQLKGFWFDFPFFESVNGGGLVKFLFVAGD